MNNIKPKMNLNPPSRNEVVTCNWCNTECLGNNLPRHNQRQGHEYISFCRIVDKNQPNILSMFKKKKEKQNKKKAKEK